MAKNYFIFYASCFPVYGYNGITICDTQYSEIHWYPKELKPLIQAIEKRYSLSKIKNIFPEDNDGIQLFLNHFEDKKLGFYTKKPENFPPMPLDWEHHSKVTNAIIDFDEYSKHKLGDIINDLDILRCSHIQMRFFHNVSKEQLLNQLDSAKHCSINSIDIVLSFSDGVSIDSLKDIYSVNSRINSVTIFNSEEDKIINDVPFLLSYMKRKITNEKSCGLITENHFSSNIRLYTETLSHNNCLNRKISIDRQGMIKNCPSMEKKYGSILTTSLLSVVDEVLNNPITKIKKDEINDCKICEYRMVCTDCRAYIDNPSDLYSKPLKCGYDPYSCEWEDWATNKLKQDVRKHYEIT